MANSGGRSLEGAAIALRVLDIREEAVQGSSLPVTYLVSPVRADTLAILMSLIIIVGAVLAVGRARKAWLLLSVAIVVSKVITVGADARVGDLPAGDLFVTRLATFVFPALVPVLLIRTRTLLEVRPLGW